jgi:hypothetical protein
MLRQERGERDRIRLMEFRSTFSIKSIVIFEYRMNICDERCAHNVQSARGEAPQKSTSALTSFGGCIVYVIIKGKIVTNSNSKIST